MNVKAKKEISKLLKKMKVKTAAEFAGLDENSMNGFYENLSPIVMKYEITDEEIDEIMKSILGDVEIS